jgi:hypothetical protein
MKKILAVMLITVFPAAAFAQGEPSLKVSGEVKTGIYWEQYQYQGIEKDVEISGDPAKEPIKVHSTDNAGPGQGRFRLNLDYDNGKNFGMRGRIQWENWTNTDSQQPLWQYAFGYGNFFEDQLTVAVGKLGASPWGINGPDIWKDLEQYNYGGGMRIEWKPAFISVGHLNAGFVLNWFDSGNKENRTATFADILRESVIGVSYTHDFFSVRLAYRLDSEYDLHPAVYMEDGKTINAPNSNWRGDELIFHLEENALNDLLPGMKIYAIGWYRGLGAEDSKFNSLKNWVYAGYDPPELWDLVTPFSAQIRFGFDYLAYDYDGLYAETKYENGPLKGLRGEFHISPSFYWHFFEKLLDVGVLFSYRQDFGENKVWDGSPYQQIELEPKVQMNLATAYIALAYNWKQEYVPGDYPQRGNNDPTKQTQSINLRFCIYY